MGTILLLISFLLIIIFAPIAYIYGFFTALFRRELNYYQKNIAISFDQLGNCIGSHIFNAIMIENKGHRFGNVDETISSVLGKNRLSNTLLPAGKVLAYILNKLEPNHTDKAIESDEL